MRIPNPFSRGSNSDEEPSLLETVGVMILVLMITVVLLITGFRLAIQQLRPQPGDGPEVVQAMEDPSGFQAEMQMIRHRDFGNAVSEQHSLRTFAIDLDSGKFMGSLVGIDPEPVRIGFDGKSFARAVGDEGDNWETIDDDTLDVSDIVPPTKAILGASKPVLLTDEGTINGHRAWIVGFEDPTTEMIEQLITAAYLKDHSLVEDEAREQDLEAIKEGRYKVKWAHAWVEYNTRHLIAMDVLFEVEEGAGYQILTQWNNIGDDSVSRFSFETEQEAL